MTISSVNSKINVGVWAGSNVISGGGFQHVTAVIKGLHHLSKEALDLPYNFTFFSPSRELKDYLDGLKIGVEFVKNSLFYRAEKFLYKISSAGTKERFKVKAPLDRLLFRHSLDVFYFVGPNRNSLLTDKPYILTVWDLCHRIQPEFPEVSDFGVWESREKFYSKAIPKASYVIVDSQTGKRDVLYYYSVEQERVKVIPYIPAVESKTDSELETIWRKIKAEHKINIPFIFYPAQFWPHKNHSYILYALKELIFKHNKALDVVFTGSDKGNLEFILQLARKLNVEDNVKSLGFVPKEHIIALYKNALALIMPSVFGPTNIPIIEAFKLGCPVVASDIEGMREQIADAGILLDLNDPGALTTNLLVLMADQNKREKMIEAGHERIKNWDSMEYAKSVVEILDELSVHLKTFKIID